MWVDFKKDTHLIEKKIERGKKKKQKINKGRSMLFDFASDKQRPNSSSAQRLKTAKHSKPIETVPRAPRNLLNRTRGY